VELEHLKIKDEVRDEKFASVRVSEVMTELLLFIIRVKRELERVYKNGCRYNERLNDETGLIPRSW